MFSAGRRAHDVAFRAQHERRRQVFLDGDRRGGLVERAVDDRKPPRLICRSIR
jgi:hypothetical protein